MASQEFIDRAKDAIEDEEEIAFDVAANSGQIFGNVKHMTWFIEALADELENG